MTTATILGGGIAGTVLAAALAHRGLEVTLYERDARDARPGAFLIMDRRGHEALARLGVPAADLEAVSHPLTTLRVEYSGSPERVRPSDGHRQYHRAALMRVLNAHLDNTSATRHYQSAVTAVSPDGALTVDGNTIVPGGIVFAADGIDSPARAGIEPTRIPVYSGQVVIYGTTSSPVALDTAPDTLHFQGVQGEKPFPAATFGHFWNDQVTVWFARLTRPAATVEELGVQPVDAWADAVHTAAPHLSGLIGKVLAATPEVHVHNARNVPIEDAKSPDVPVILLGDADHAISPAAGTGARDAIEDVEAIVEAITEGRSAAGAMAARRQQILEERAQAMRAMAAPPRPTS
ncbi:FAD-dependent oxidoreductase [Nocardia sp. NPDC004582]